MKKNLKSFQILSLFLLIAFSRHALGQETVREYDGIISSGAVQAPAGRFLLIRNKTNICAIKFIETLRDNNKSEANTFLSNEESFRSKYIWYLGEKKEERWLIHPPISTGKSEATRGSLWGIGRLAFGGGNNLIECGPIKVKWSSPAHVYFYRYSKSEDQGYEIAVSTQTMFDDIDLNSSELHWYRFTNEPRNIPIK